MRTRVQPQGDNENYITHAAAVSELGWGGFKKEPARHGNTSLLPSDWLLHQNISRVTHRWLMKTEIAWKQFSSASLHMGVVFFFVKENNTRYNYITEAVWCFATKRRTYEKRRGESIKGEEGGVWWPRWDDYYWSVGETQGGNEWTE